MKVWMRLLILGIIIILISSPLGYELIRIVYRNRSLSGEYVPILNGFINSLMLVGGLTSLTGIEFLIKDKK